jgi:hypothetical protein
VLLHFTIFKSKAQVNYQVFANPKAYNLPDTSRLFASLQSYSFLHNREYFDEIADGYTLFGHIIKPQLNYQVASNVCISAGLLAAIDFGNVGFRSLQPVYGISIMKDSAIFTFGNINSHLAHGLLEPMGAFENSILRPAEQGIQLLSNKNGRFLDIWIDWQNMIYRNSTDQEVIAGGLHYKPRFWLSSNTKLQIPLQFTALHRGGQIGYNSMPISTVFNLAIGPELTFGSSQSRQYHINAYYLGQKNDLAPKQMPVNGKALLLNFTTEKNRNQIAINYWQGRDFMSGNGGDIYQNHNKYKFATPTSTRKLLIFRLIKDYKITDNIYITARFEPYYNLISKKLNHAEGLYINYKQNFRIR